MSEDVLIIVAVVISVVIIVELIFAVILCIRCTKKRYGWFTCEYFNCITDDCNCVSHKKLHKYKIRKLSFQSTSTKSGSRSTSINNKLNLKLPFPIIENNNNKQIYTIESNETFQINTNDNQNLNHTDEIIKNKMKLKNRMNSYLYAIHYRDMINQIEKMNKKTENKNEYKFNIELNDNIKLKNLIFQSNDIENNSSNLNTDSPLTDNTIPSPPSSLNLVSLSRCPSPPAPITIYPYQLTNEFESIESDDIIHNLKYNNKVFNENLLKMNIKQNDTEDNEESLMSSLNFIRSYLDKYDDLQQSNNRTHNYINDINTDDIINNTIEFINNYKPIYKNNSN